MNLASKNLENTVRNPVSFIQGHILKISYIYTDVYIAVFAL